MNKVLLSLILVLCSSAASAADGDVATFGELDQLRAANALLDVKVKNAELQKKLNEFNGVAPANSPAGQASAYIAQTKSASVQSVSGSTAVIQLANGSSVSVRPGSKIPGLGTVSKVSVREVLIAEGKTLVALPFAGDAAPVTQAPAAPGSFPVMPAVNGVR